MDQKWKAVILVMLAGRRKHRHLKDVKITQSLCFEFTKNPDVTPEDLRKPVPPAAPVAINVPERLEPVSQRSVPETYAVPPSG